MPEDCLDLALAQIEAADLPCPVYRTARRLLDRADYDSGWMAVAEAELMAICQTAAEGTMRSHLVQLQAAGILRYNRRGLTIRIGFAAWAEPLPLEASDDIKVIAERSNRALSDHFVEEDDIKVIDQRSDRALSDHFYVEEGGKLIAERSNRALSDQNAPSTSHARSGWVGRSSTTKPTRKIKPTHPPKPSRDSPLEPMQQLAFELLVDSEVGLLHEVARGLAVHLPATDIYRLVDEWLPDRRVGAVRPGALVTRLRQLVGSPWGPEGSPDAPTVTLSAGFRNSDLFRRHRLPDEFIADPERRKYSL